jgi:hypothetical protein
MYARLTIGQFVDAHGGKIDLLRVGTQGALRVAEEIFSDLGLANLLQISFVSVNTSSRLVQLYHCYGISCARPLSIKSPYHVAV